jgi:hypothetical protein
MMVTKAFCHQLQGDEIRPPVIEASGLFESSTGFYDLCPIQFEGYLTNGQYLYFNARETRVLLEIYPSQEDFCDTDKRLARYRVIVDVDDAGLMSPEDCAGHVLRCVRQYQSSVTPADCTSEALGAQARSDGPV